jgi:hypothetical protein
MLCGMMLRFLLQQPGKLTSERGEKISEVEGVTLSPRMRTALEMSKGQSGEERRALIRAQFGIKSTQRRHARQP